MNNSYFCLDAKIQAICFHFIKLVGFVFVLFFARFLLLYGTDITGKIHISYLSSPHNSVTYLEMYFYGKKLSSCVKNVLGICFNQVWVRQQTQT